MALIIKTTETKTIEVPGLDLTLDELYVRLEFAGRADGKTMEIAPTSYKNKEKYLANDPCQTNVPINNLRVELERNEMQSLETAHKYAKIAYEQLGYEVTIDI